MGLTIRPWNRYVGTYSTKELSHKFQMSRYIYPEAPRIRQRKEALLLIVTIYRFLRG